MSFFIDPSLCLLFFRDSDASFTPDRLRSVLADAKLTVEGDVEPFAVRFGDGPTLHVSVVHGAVAPLLAERPLRKNDGRFRALAADCNAYIEIRCDALDEVLNEINTLIEVQCTLQDATSALIYCSWNQSFSGPDE
jgi:hypothetical protein